MAELLLVSNPHKRRKHRRRARRSNPRRRHRARRSNPFGRRRRRMRHRNPRLRSRRRRNPRFRSVRRRHRNPSLAGITGRIMPTFKAGFVGAGGALANDVLWGLISPYLPSLLTSAGTAAPVIQYAVQMLSAVAVGMLGGMARLPGQDMAVGAATCATHDFLKTQLQSMAPTLFGSGAPLALSGYNGMGAYLSGSAPIVGTATFPATYLPQHQNVQMGAYLSGDVASGAGVYMDDAMGQDYWASH
jgi:hypothetical protein